MKEIENKEKIEIQVKQQKQIEHAFDSDILPHKGHSIWEIDIETLEIKKAQYSNATYKMFEENKKEIIKKKGCVYISALNKKNALKHYKNGKNGGITSLDWNLDPFNA